MGEADPSGLGRRAALRRRSGLAAAGAVGVTGAALLPGGRAGAISPTGVGMSVGFNVINPYRSVDTREFGPAGRLSAGFSEDWDVWTDWDGKPKIPQSAAAVTFNLTVVETAGNGFLAIYPAGTEYGGISTINWTGNGVILANGGTVALGTSAGTGAASVTVECGGFASTQYIIDITGYYGA